MVQITEVQLNNRKISKKLDMLNVDITTTTKSNNRATGRRKPQHTLHILAGSTTRKLGNRRGEKNNDTKKTIGSQQKIIFEYRQRDSNTTDRTTATKTMTRPTRART